MAVITLNGSQTLNNPDASDIQAQTNLGQLHDVSLSGLQNGDIISYSGGTWINQNIDVVASLDDLTDVIITNIQDGDIIQYNNASGFFENVPFDIAVNDLTVDTLTANTVTAIDEFNIGEGTASTITSTGNLVFTTDGDITFNTGSGYLYIDGGTY